MADKPPTMNELLGLFGSNQQEYNKNLLPRDTENRALVAVTKPSAAKLVIESGGNAAGLFHGGPTGWADEYDSVYGPSQFEQLFDDMDKDQIRSYTSAQNHMMSSLMEQLGGAVTPELSDQIASVSMALAGGYGDKASLIGIDPNVKQLAMGMMGQQGTFNGRSGKVKLFDTDQNFNQYLIDDGIQTENAIKGSGSGIKAPVLKNTHNVQELNKVFDKRVGQKELTKKKEQKMNLFKASKEVQELHNETVSFNDAKEVEVQPMKAKEKKKMDTLKPPKPKHDINF